MGIFDFFSSIATNFKNHYINLAQNSAIQRGAPTGFHDPQQAIETAPENTDTYSPTFAPETNSIPTAPTEPDRYEPAAEDGDVVPDDGSQEVAEEESAQPYRFRHQAHLNYEVRLEFQLRAVAQIAQQIADGEVVSSEELAAAGFGLNADMRFDSFQFVEESGSGQAQVKGHTRSSNLVKARQAQSFALQSRNFALESFSRESVRIQQSMDTKTRNKYGRAVNRFSLRYSMDSRFSFAYLNQFNVQTERMSQTSPESVSPYTESAGNVAEKSTPEMMAAFFNAVDAYLNDAEENLLARANKFFEMAAADLGFSENILNMARDHLTGTIDSFFNRVDEAVSGLASMFGAETPEAVAPEPVYVNPTGIDLYRIGKEAPSANVAMA